MHHFFKTIKGFPDVNYVFNKLNLFNKMNYKDLLISLY